MRRAQLTALVPRTTPEAVLREVVRFDRYPLLAPHVRSTTVHQTLPEATGRSSWELRFRSGLLRWTERERFDVASGVIEFEQLDGDFDTFSGRWLLTADGADATVFFAADFDFGIPSLAGILDPIAERVIRETVAWAVVGSFPRATLTGDNEDLITSSRARS